MAFPCILWHFYHWIHTILCCQGTFLNFSTWRWPLSASVGVDLSCN